MKIVDARTIHEGKKFDLVRHVMQTSDGKRVERDFCRHQGAVVIIPLLPGDRVVLIRNYRHAPDVVLLELPAGTLDAGENPDDAAVRELAEETGYRAGSIERLTEFYPSPGISNERMYLYVAERMTAGEMALEEDEQIVPEIVPLKEALAMASDGRLRDAKTMVGLWFFAIRRGLLTTVPPKEDGA
ncbi:NUDIX hydrolase [Kolteria novifilia]|uniref:NUDIX hydrolase n=1 Tax=Kolteria novifilia TaxID=2527975 RepID=UPI003AF3A434